MIFFFLILISYEPCQSYVFDNFWLSIMVKSFWIELIIIKLANCRSIIILYDVSQLKQK
jgi:hypothetical protein